MKTNPSVKGAVRSVNAGQLLFVGRALDFRLTTDQALTKLFSGTNYYVTSIIAKRVSGGASVACVGGIYDAASKGGNALVGAAQSWVTLGSNVNVVPTLAAVISTALTSATPFLSLTTGSTAAITADVFIFGYCID